MSRLYLTASPFHWPYVLQASPKTGPFNLDLLKERQTNTTEIRVDSKQWIFHWVFLENTNPGNYSTGNWPYKIHP